MMGCTASPGPGRSEARTTTSSAGKHTGPLQRIQPIHMSALAASLLIVYMPVNRLPAAAPYSSIPCCVLSCVAPLTRCAFQMPTRCEESRRLPEVLIPTQGEVAVQVLHGAHPGPQPCQRDCAGKGYQHPPHVQVRPLSLWPSENPNNCNTRRKFG